MISIDNLSVEFSTRPLFTDASFVINDKDRIALVGKNGAGKSTLLKIIAGMQAPTRGAVSVPRETMIGYLPQVMVLADGRTVREEAEEAFASIHELERRVAALNDELARRTDYESEEYMQLVERFAHESERFQMLGGMNYQAELERTLIGLGFEREDFDRPTSEFSGGWRMRIELAKLLLQRPDVLLLRTLEISCGHIYDYKVRYDEYVRLRAERREQQLRALENQQKEIADARAFIDRFRYQATKAIQVQQKIRQLEKIVPIEVDEVDNSSLRLKFTCSQRSGDYPVICEDVAKRYGDQLVFSGVNLTVKRGEKVAFVGRNGGGKTTLVKCIMGEIPFEGRLQVGHNVQIGYFAQNQAQLLDPEPTVFDTIDRVARGDIRLRIRDILGAFMFGGEASDKKVKVLSGGERTRLAMIKLLLEPVNLLILDEPTNHLDMRSKDVLKEAIRDFDGTVIVVSHDRDFLDGLVSKVYEFGEGRVREHLGGIYDWIALQEARDSGQPSELLRHSTAASATPHQTVGGTPPSPAPQTSGGAAAYAEQKAAARQRKKLERTVQEAEEHVGQLEAAVAILEQQMSTPEGSADMSLYEKHTRLKKQLAQAEAEWEQAYEALSAL